MEQGDEDGAKGGGGKENESASPGSACSGAANIKVVLPVPRELNPNARPFKSAKQEFREMLMQPRQSQGHAYNITSEISHPEQNPPCRRRGTGTTVPERTETLETESHEHTQGDSELLTKFSRWNFGREAAANERTPCLNPWTGKPSQSNRMAYSSSSAPTNAAGNEVAGKSSRVSNVNTLPLLDSISKLLVEMNGRLETLGRIQYDQSHQLQTVDLKLGSVTTRLENLEERKQGGSNSFDGGRMENSRSRKVDLGLNSEADYWGYGDGAGDQDDVYSPDEREATLSNNSPSTLNNQVPPGTRANNFHDNFRSYSQQNLLSAHSIPVSGRRGRDTTPGISFTNGFSRRVRESSDSGVWPTHTRKSSTPRNTFRGAEFVENIGTKLRNKEQDVRRIPMRRNENSASSVRSRSPHGRDREPLTPSLGIGADGMKSIMEVISVFLERNGSRPMFIFSLFERLAEITTDAERTEIILCMDTILRTGLMDGARIVPIPNTGGQGRSGGATPVIGCGPSTSSNSTQFEFGDHEHGSRFYSPYHNNLQLKCQLDTGKVSRTGISPDLGLPRDRPSMEQMRTSTVDTDLLGPMLGSEPGPWQPGGAEGGLGFLNQARGTTTGSDTRDTSSEIAEVGIGTRDNDKTLPGSQTKYFFAMSSPVPTDPEELDSDDSDVFNLGPYSRRGKPTEF